MGHAFCIASDRSSRRVKGFSLIEVMIVVVIIGILAALAYPNLQNYLMRTRQTEAKTNLSAIYTAQKIYFSIQGQYANELTSLDISIGSGEDAVYSYSVTGNSNSFTATAQGNLNADSALDTWTINQDKLLQNTINDITID